MLKAIMCIAMWCVLAYGEDKLASPCPGKFEYTVTNTQNSWNGTLTLNSEFTLHGLWIRVFFDRAIKSISSTNHFVNVYHNDLDEKSYLLENRNFLLKKNTPLNVPIHVKYDGDHKPLLTKYRLNAREVCIPDID